MDIIKRNVRFAVEIEWYYSFYKFQVQGTKENYSHPLGQLMDISCAFAKLFLNLRQVEYKVIQGKI